LATSTFGRIVQEPQRRSSPNQPTTRNTVSTFGSEAFRSSSATDQSEVERPALSFSGVVEPPPRSRFWTLVS
jgi:hypothetical protein